MLTCHSERSEESKLRSLPVRQAGFGASRLRMTKIFIHMICFSIGVPCATPVFSAEPYFITIQKLELKNDRGEWLTILEPDHRVDLNNTEAAVSFFNNGRVPPGSFKNFRITYEDHGKSAEMSRKTDWTPPFQVKNGSFVNVSFKLDLDSKKVKETHLVVDQEEWTDSGDNIEMHSQNNL